MALRNNWVMVGARTLSSKWPTMSTPLGWDLKLALLSQDVMLMPLAEDAGTWLPIEPSNVQCRTPLGPLHLLQPDPQVSQTHA
jgi:hypothetical protein